MKKLSREMFTIVSLLALFCAKAHAIRSYGEFPRSDSPALHAMDQELKQIMGSSNPVTLVLVTAQASADYEHGYSRDLAEAEHNATLFLLWHFSDEPLFKMVERQRLDSILREAKLTYTGLLSRGNEPSDFAGVNYLLFVSEIGLETGNEITYKLVELKSARIIAAASDFNPY